MASEYIKKLQAGLSPKERLYQIVEHGLCIGCGICQSVAGPENMKLELAEIGYPRPIVHGDLDHETMDRIIDVCPGTRVEGMPEWQIDDNSLHDDVWGVWRQIYFSYAAEPEVRHMAATGGVLTALALYLVESKEVDFVLHACEPQGYPSFGVRMISRTRDDVLKASGSRYGPTATLEDVIQILDQACEAGETFAFIGTPCDVSALRNYARQDKRVDETCLYMMTMVCGGFMDPSGMENFLNSINVEFDQITSFRYRGYGCPGPTTIKTSDGRKISKNYLEFWGEDESAWQLTPRCKICPDGIGDSADIAAADCWDGGSPTWEEQKTDLGSNATVVRTQLGVELMNNAITAGCLVRGADLTPADMNRFQPHQENKKRSIWARFQGMKEAGHLVPDTKRLRLEALFLDNDDQFNLDQAEGAKQRVQAGKFSEPTPKKPGQRNKGSA